jgi:hypothetical protein
LFDYAKDLLIEAMDPVRAAMAAFAKSWRRE